MASIISTLTEREIDPVEMSQWAVENGYYVPNQGSLHSIIPDGARAFGLNVEPMYYAEKEDIVTALEDGKYVVMISGPGTFSDTSGHFIVLIDINEFGEVRISDSIKYSYTKLNWDIDEIIREASPVSNDGGPFWAIWLDEE